MKLRWPWAKRDHRHPSEYLWQITRCEGCGHLLLSQHVDNVHVLVEEHHPEGFKSERMLTYGPECAPAYRKLILFEDGTRKELGGPKPKVDY